MERLDEFRFYADPQEAILNLDMITELVPMKPVFYDLAFDLLEATKSD